MTKAVNETYLGDGLYGSFDGFTLWLRAPRTGGDHYVGLEPLVFKEFLAFAEECGVLIVPKKPPGSGGGGMPFGGQAL